jgi:hypothetical protein
MPDERPIQPRLGNHLLAKPLRIERQLGRDKNMRTALYSAAAIAATLMLQSAAADAEVRNFFSPQVAEARVAFCLQSGECGKPVADAWCQVNGFDEAVLFQRQETRGEALAILYSDTGARCSDETCTSYHQIKCRSSS